MNTTVTSNAGASDTEMAEEQTADEPASSSHDSESASDERRDQDAEPDTGAADNAVVEVSSEVSAVGSPGVTPGEMLRAAREQAGVSMEELMGETKLTRSVIQALESNSFDGLPKPVYVRGYYKKCAYVLNTNEGLIVQAYNNLVGEEKAPEPVPFTLPPSAHADFGGTRRSGSPAKSVLIVLVLGSIFGMAAFWYLNTQRSESETVNDDSVLEMPLNPLSGEAETSPPETVALTELLAEPDVTEVTVVEPEDEAETEAMQSAEPAEPAAAPVSVSGGDLFLEFVQSCWTDIRDKEGNRLLFGLIEAGTEHRIGGVLPYRVLLGNPQGVNLQFAGQAVDLKAHTRANKTAVFTLGG